MASIDAFLELAEASSDPKPWPRVSMRRARAGERMPSEAQRRERTIAVLVVIALELAMLLALRAAMRPVAGHARTGDTPLLISFVTLPKTSAVPASVSAAASAVAPRPRATASARSATPHHEQPQTATIPPIRNPAIPAPSTPAPSAPTVQFYSRDGELLLPPAPSGPAPRDLLAHRDLSRMIPGAPRADSPDFHVRPGIAPKDVVNTAAAIVGGLLAHGNAPLPDSMGLPPPKPDRGLRTSGRDTDPCEDIAIDMANTSDPRLAQMAEDRYQRHCEGH